MVNVGVFGVPARVRGNAARSIWLFFVIMLLFVAIGAEAAAEPRRNNVDSEGYSIDRYDPVAYFTEGQPVRGQREFTVEYEGAKYAFTSESNRALFLGDPEQYVPQYGGYCAYGVAHGSRSNVDPEVWDIVDGRLYLMISAGTMSVWQKKKKAHIEMANKAWQTIVE